MTPKHFDAQWQQRCRHWAEAAGEDGAHDLAHIERVVTLAQQLALEEGADLDVVLPAAWLHDVVLIDKRDPRRSQASVLAADKAIELLRQHGYPTELLPAIHHAIASHSWSAGIPPETLEARVVQDADRLDALGAIGLARCLMLGGQFGNRLYHSADPFADNRELDDSRFCLDHFSVKLQHLAPQMSTPAGRAEGQRRWDYMQHFIDTLRAELGQS
ncbi:HD domain-containing protein [Ferrimonas marina]|uniref:HD domain-containing protein n=1 Tax=Ferrimonas marina TaxID=299255 RepID=A0A1M5XQS0_9GAMM|nr:HD domain-containing protein [Ferrimonas marina]SHI01878.1 uncharacterized protein SAMN02745129_3595 [Ferrimonas marina]